jgi:hypothetical protein
MSQPWLSCIIHSEAFQARLAEQKEKIFNGTVLPLKEKMTAIAHQALDQIGDRMPLMKDETVASIADSTLDRLGFGSKPGNLPPGAPPGSVSININLRAELEEARKQIGARSAVSPAPALEVLVDGELAPIGIGSPQEVQAARLSDLRDTSAQLSMAFSHGAGAAVPAGAEV